MPFFHSFGYTVSLGSAVLPFGCVYHHNPLDAKTVGELAEKERATLLITTPTFLQLYSRRVDPKQFGGLSAVVTGAERLPDSIAEEFNEHFDIYPLQGYGTTECSPAVAVNVPDHRSPGMFQVGHKRGSIGHAAGIVVRTIDPDTAGLTAPNSRLLWVKGPNVMPATRHGEKARKSCTTAVEHRRHGLHRQDGFVFITGRLSRLARSAARWSARGVETRCARRWN